MPSIISLWASVYYHSAAQCHHIQSTALWECQLSENRISHLWFEVQKPQSPGEKFKSGLLFLIEQFPMLVQSIQISVIIPDTTNQFFLFTLYYFPSVSLPRWEKDCVRQQKDLANGEKCTGRLNELATVIGMMSSYEVTSNDNATDAHWKAGTGW